MVKTSTHSGALLVNLFTKASWSLVFKTLADLIQTAFRPWSHANSITTSETITETLIGFLWVNLFDLLYHSHRLLKNAILHIRLATPLHAKPALSYNPILPHFVGTRVIIRCVQFSAPPLQPSIYLIFRNHPLITCIPLPITQLNVSRLLARKSSSYDYLFC